METPTLSPPGSGPPPASSWSREKWRLEHRASGSSCAPRGTGLGPSPWAFTVPPRPRLVQEARASQPRVPGPAPRRTAPWRLEGAGAQGASWALGSHLGLKGGGRGRPSGGWPWWGPAVPRRAWKGAGLLRPGCGRAACPPSVPRLPGDSPQVVQTELRARNCAGLQSGHVSKERGAVSPWRGGRGAGPRRPPLWVSFSRPRRRARLSRALPAPGAPASLGLPSLRPPRTLRSPPRLF